MISIGLKNSFGTLTPEGKPAANRGLISQREQYS
jgi:hypothetical protein